MTEPTPMLVVFGRDGEGRARAARFTGRDAELAVKAATLLGYRIAWISDEAGRAIAEALPDGNVFARGHGFVRLVRPPVFERLIAFIDGEGAAIPEQRGSDER